MIVSYQDFHEDRVIGKANRVKLGYLHLVGHRL